jgi:hypothetical protein
MPEPGRINEAPPHPVKRRARGWCVAGKDDWFVSEIGHNEDSELFL